MNDLQFVQIDLTVDGVDLAVSAVRRDGASPPIVFLHGFGSTKEDYIDIAFHASLGERPFLAFDAPGCGETVCSDLAAVTIAFQVKTAVQLLQRLRIGSFHLVGHSMGGLAALLLAAQERSRVLSFVDIKGNLAPEDCFLSRQITSCTPATLDAFFADFVARTRASTARSSALYAASLQHKVRPGAVPGIFTSMVELSDHGDLLQTFLALPCPRVFMYGEEYSWLSYLPALAKSKGVELAEIPHSGHFPMYSNPVEMWRRIADFYARNDL